MLKPIRYLLMGIHFILAGIANLALCIARPFHPDNSRLVAQAYSRPAQAILGIDLRIDTASLSALTTPAVIVCNHQSNFDLFLVGAAVPKRTVTVGKKSLKWIPLFGQIFWLAGNILIDRGNPRAAKAAMLKTSAKLQNDNTSIWIFPEGTRNKGNGLLPFKSGAFKMAVAAHAPLVIACASSYKSAMDLSRLRSARVAIKTLAPISTMGLSESDIPALMAHCHALMVQGIAELDAEMAKLS
jgi:1-acyl-sn-glycerol-3-phosphate acyltransferase